MRVIGLANTTLCINPEALFLDPMLKQEQIFWLLAQPIQYRSLNHVMPSSYPN
jgi:hypothetical protein